MEEKSVQKNLIDIYLRVLISCQLPQHNIYHPPSTLLFNGRHTPPCIFCSFFSCSYHSPVVLPTTTILSSHPPLQTNTQRIHTHRHHQIHLIRRLSFCVSSPLWHHHQFSKHLLIFQQLVIMCSTEKLIGVLP